jgi:hypothetical protein
VSTDDYLQKFGDRVWAEYKYRHEHTWNTVFKLTLSVLAISVLPYTQQTVVCVIGKPILTLPFVAAVLSVFGSVVINRELRILARVRDVHRTLQRTTDLGADWFRPLVLSYLVALTIAACVNCDFVRTWQESVSSAYSGRQCLGSVPPR